MDSNRGLYCYLYGLLPFIMALLYTSSVYFTYSIYQVYRDICLVYILIGDDSLTG